ncbi:MAG TPA: hypothetical protein VFN67_17880 [Polyangiales bacterium]|nr:hypothetical protein [Polyangiales bacterium]
MKSLRFAQLILRSSMVCVLAAAGCETEDDEPQDKPDASADLSKDEAKDAPKSESKEEPKAEPNDAQKSEANEEPKKEEPAKQPEDELKAAPLYGVSTISSAGDETVSYISVLDKLDGQTLDFSGSREFSGQADLWVASNEIFISDGETLEIGKYTLQDKKLKDAGKVNFSNTGVVEVGFWTSVFISPEKAYVFNNTAEAIIWNPKTLEITGSIKLPEFKNRDALEPFPGYSDRAAVVRGKRLFQPIYWTSTENFFSYDNASQILIIDIEKDEVVETLDAPCPGLDFATQDDDGNIYYSSWVFAPPAAAVVDQPKTCIVKIPASDDTKVETAFNVADVADGHEGGALRYVGNGKAVLSVFHPEHATGDTDVQTVAFGPNWRFWSIDLKSQKAEAIEGIDWNAGAAYTSKVGTDTFLLVPDGDYASTTFYRATGSIDPKPVLKTKGWSMRLFEMP